MADDTISRQMAIDVLGKIFPADPMRNDYTKGITCGAALATEYIKQLPSAQPEQKRGKWINDRGLYKCSCCNRLWAEWWVISKPIERMRKDMPYCPMCGSYNGEEN